MQLFVGLGNPGAKYAQNRHNIGFMALDEIADLHGFAPWRTRFQGLLSEGRLGTQKVLLLKPETFMNLSGQSVGEAMRFFKLDPQDVTVFHDELDLAPGKLRVKSGGGHAGHNGLRSIHQHIGETYQRIRMGIGHPGRKELVAQYVLHDFAKSDQDWLTPTLRGIAKGAPELAAGKADRFQNAVALEMQGQSGTKPTKAAQSTPQPTTPQTTKAAPASEEASPAPDERSALQKLADKFR